MITRTGAATCPTCLAPPTRYRPGNSGALQDQLQITFSTRLINSGVPQHIVQMLLGHASPNMTGHYAHVHDSTIRDAFDRYQSQRVNISGQRIGYHPDAPTASAEWVKHNLNRVRDSLPNGYCGRPAQQDCPHP